MLRIMKGLQRYTEGKEEYSKRRKDGSTRSTGIYRGSNKAQTAPKYIAGIVNSCSRKV